MFLKKIGWFVSLEVEKDHQSWEPVFVTKVCLRYKNQKHSLKWKFWTKKLNPLFLECAERHVFRLSKITNLRVFLVFVTKERPILTVLKQMILVEIKLSNGIKPQKINFFMNFCKFLPHKGTFCWKVPSQNSFTFYLKHQKYPFCAPIFHPLSENELYATFDFFKIRIG